MSDFNDSDVLEETSSFYDEVTEQESESLNDGESDKKGLKKIIERLKNKETIERLKKRKKSLIIGGIIGVVLLFIIINIIAGAVKGDKDNAPQYTDVSVERRTIQNSITGSSSIEPNDSYNVTTIKSGDIDADYFKEGDTVKKGDKLYQFDDDDAQKSLTTARNAVTKAEQSYTDAVKSKSQTVKSNSNSKSSSQNALTKAQVSLNDAQDTYDKQYVKSDMSGKVKEVYVSVGDTVTNGAKIADVYNDDYMKLVVPFNTGDAENVYVGADAEVSVVGAGDVIYGTVTEKSSSSSATSYHTSVVYVTIELTNPGVLTEADSGSAVVNGAACADSANFKCIGSRSVIAEVSGTVDRVYVVAGDSVSGGTQIVYINSTQAQNSLKNAQLSYDDAVLSIEKQNISSDTFSQDSQIKNAKLSLDDAKIQLQKAEDEVKDYLIEAPIDGTVVTKNAKAGDTIDTANSKDALCVIYDLSCVKFSIDVDETEIALVKTGQSVKVTADAVDGEFEGTVVKVPVDGVNENGVTTYTVEVQIDDYGELLPGMNIDAEITVEEAENVLAVPVNSVNRGDIVFVKDDGTERANDVTDMINGSKDTESADKPEDVKKRSEKEAPPMQSGKPAEDMKMDGIPMNIEIPEGYRAIKVETGINDTEYIEIKSGLAEGDTVRALDTESSSANASFGNGEEMMPQMGGMSGNMGGGMPAGGGMGGGSRSGGGMPGGGGGMR